MLIADLGDHPEWVQTLARWHFDCFGRLTGAGNLDDYVALLTRAAASRTLPSVLVALDNGELLGSANLVASDLPSRDDLTPWLGQLFVDPAQRSRGVGAALVRSVIGRARECGYRRVYLYTAGTLPEYYVGLGWREIERVSFLGKERVVMAYEVTSDE